jgi:hypothetical protein
MMNTATPFLVLNSDCGNSAKWLINQLASANLTVLRTFNSNDVRSTSTECLCPHHGTSQCNCQIMIFLVYQRGHASPVSLVVHGYDQFTLFYVVDTPQQRADPALESLIHNVLVPTPAQFFTQVDQSVEQPSSQ